VKTPWTFCSIIGKKWFIEGLNALPEMRIDVILKTSTSRVRFVMYVHTKPVKYKVIKNLQRLRSPRYRRVFNPSHLAPRVHVNVNPVALSPHSYRQWSALRNPSPFLLKDSHASNKRRPQHATHSSWPLSLRLSCSLLISSPPTNHAAARTISRTTSSSMSLRGA